MEERTDGGYVRLCDRGQWGGGFGAGQPADRGPGVTVCVLECGPPDRHPYIHIPAGFIKMLFNPTYTWQFQTEPGEGINGRRIPTTQGRTLGGSSSINGMIYNRGQREDFDHWAQRGNRGWGYVDILPYFKRGERRLGAGDDRIHGRAGNLPVTDNDWIHPVMEAFIEGAQELGMPRCEDYNSGDNQMGVGYFQRLIHRGYRHSAARVFLHPARASGRLEVRTDARAARILFDGTRATGVRYVNDRDRSERREVFARKEVIVSSGTANTAKLLQMSGVGPAWLLSDLGVPVVADLPVGENFRDHYSTRVVARVKNIRTINEMSHGIGLMGQIARWAMGKPSILAVAPSIVHWFWKTEDTMRQPDLQGVFSPASYKQGFVGLLDDYPGMTVRGLAAPAGEHRLCPRAVHRSVRGPDHPAELSEGPNGSARAGQGHALGAPVTAHPGSGALFRSDALPGTRRAYRRGVAGLRPAIWLDRVSPDRHRPDGAGDGQDIGGGRSVAGARAAGHPRGRCLDHAEHAVGEHLQLDHDDRRESVGHDPRPAAVAAGGGDRRMSLFPSRVFLR